MFTFTEKETKRIFSKILIDPDSKCWNWKGTIDQGYGRLSFRGKQIRAHRLLYTWKHGKIEEWTDKKSKEVDHVCKNRSCCNPSHLRLVSNKVNVLRGTGPTAINSRKNTCIYGHNSLYKVGNRRRCRECRRILDASDERKQWRKKRTITSHSRLVS